MRAALQWIGAGIAMLVVSAVGLYGLSRWLGPTDAQERALALMNQPRPLPGNNAFAALWLLPYDVPAGAVEAVAAQDVRAFAARSAPGRRIAGTGTGTGTAEAFVSSAAQRLEKFADNGKPVLCKPDKPGCLDQVRAQLPAYAQWRDGHRALIERAALGNAGHYRNEFVPSLSSPIPSWGIASPLRLTAHAVGFAQGERDAALAGVCGDALTWRGLARNTDSLITKMAAFNAVSGFSRLFAEMLVQAPVRQPLPEACALAFAPPQAAESSMCEAMKGEFAFVTTAIDGLALDERSGNDAPWLLDSPMTRARMASMYSPFCSVQVDRAIAGDWPATKLLAPYGWGFDCVSNYAGCILTNIAQPAHHDYLLRAQDYGAHLRLAGTLLWLHQHADDTRPLAQRLAARPLPLRSPARNIEIVDGGRALQVRHYETHGEPSWRLPLVTSQNAGVDTASDAAGATARMSAAD